MKECFEAYPELIQIAGLPVYLMLTEDSNGQSEIVAREYMSWMMEQHNENWKNVRVVMAVCDRLWEKRAHNQFVTKYERSLPQLRNETLLLAGRMKSDRLATLNSLAKYCNYKRLGAVCVKIR